MRKMGSSSRQRMSSRRPLAWTPAKRICLPGAASCFCTGRTNRPSRFFSRRRSVFPDSPRLWIGLGMALYSRGKYEDSIKALLTAADLSPSDARCYSPNTVLCRVPSFSCVLFRFPTPVGALHPGDEARHHRLDLVEDHPPRTAGLGQRVGQQVQDQLLVGLAGGEDAHVRQRAAGSSPRSRSSALALIARSCAAGASSGRRRELLGGPCRHPRQRARVDPEQLVHRPA